MKRAFFALLLREAALMTTPQAFLLVCLAYLWGWLMAMSPSHFPLSMSLAAVFLGAWWGSQAWSEELQSGRWQIQYSLPCRPVLLSQAKALLLLGVLVLSLGILELGWWSHGHPSVGTSPWRSLLLLALPMGFFATNLAAGLSVRQFSPALAFTFALVPAVILVVASVHGLVPWALAALSHLLHTGLQRPPVEASSASADI